MSIYTIYFAFYFIFRGNLTAFFAGYFSAGMLYFSGRKYVRCIMKKRRDIRETLMKSATVDFEGASYTYSLFVRESNRVASYRIPLYSITVEMIDREGQRTYAEARDAFSDIGKATVFYEKIMEHLATPINLPYILEDEYCT